jgi:LuxR family transcriptional regulator, maltose regulon positive regulatory protein
MSGNRIDEQLFDSREESTMTPTIQGKTLVYRQDGQEQVLTVDTAAWFAWLETASTFSFVSETGSLTARREQAGHKRGGWYWKAYRKQHGKLSSRYLGKSETLTLARLQTVAQALAATLVETAPETDADEARTSAQAAAPGMRSDALTPLLATKLHRPLPRAQLVRRPQLAERLTQGMMGPLTLVSAPAGFGKTTLLAQWLAESGMPAAWLSLEPGDNEPVRFLSYLIAALQTLVPHLGVEALTLLQMPQQARAETVLTLLTNDVGSHGRDEGDFALVLDDYHEISAKAIDHALTYLVEHLPPQMHLVIATREDPPLPLAQLRARGHLTEVRAVDLRFTASEAAAFLTQVMGLSLLAEDIAVLEDRTEGWIAGLQLAALSLQGHQDVPKFIRAFAGDHRYIVDYLVAEVLQRQSAPVRSFLLQTSILDRLNGPLCDAVTGQEEGNARLEALERGNFFVVPLDDTRHWYRYHHLFADVLSAHLMAEQPEQVSTLHRHASAWYEQHGEVSDAIRHALAAEDFGRAADLIELAVPDMGRNRQEATVLGWLKALPEELVRARPVLSVNYAGALLLHGELEGVEARLSDAERWLDRKTDMGASSALTSSAEMVVVNEEEFRGLPGTIAVYRAAIALALGDVANTMKYARRAFDLVPEDDHHWRGSAAGFLGLAYWTSGDLEAAHRSYAECMALVQRAGYLSDAIGCSIALANIRIAQGHLREAMSTYERGLQFATAQSAVPLRGAADMYVGMSELHLERDDLDTATQHLLRSKELGEYMGLPQNRYRWCVAMARIRTAEGDLDGALDLLHEAERLYMGDFFPNVRPIAALVTRVWVAQGRLGEAFDWARELGLSAHDDLSYLREVEHITLARVLLARSKSDRTEHSMLEAMELLERLLHAAEAGERTGSIIEILIVQALAHQMQGDISSALAPLERALSLAEPEGYVRIFVDEGPLMAVLLAKLHEHARKRPHAALTNVPLAYIERLLALLRGERVQEGISPAAPSAPAPAQSLLDPLTERELEVLRLIAAGLSNRAIAARLVLALSTVKSYVNTIYGKLQVESRTQAVARARALHLLSESSDPRA